MSKKVYLTFESSLTDVCEVNASFDRGILRICYPGQNRNKTYIAREDLERCVKTLPYVPVVGNYIREEEDFGGHDVEVITTLDGTLRMVNKTQPVGVVPGNAKIYFDTIVDTYGHEQEYLFTEVLLWKRQEAYKKIKEDGVISHSMEITVKSGETIDGIFHIYDFEFTALCLLGSNVEPCFEDSALEVFTTSDFKAQFELMMNDFKESFNLATTSLEDNSYSQNDTLMKGGEEDLETNKDVFTEEEVVETEPVTEEFVEEEVPAEPEAEVEEVFEEAEEAEEPAEEVKDEPAEEFALTNDIWNALFDTLWNKDRIQTDDGYMRVRYWMVDFDIELSMVYFEDVEEDWKLFGCEYHMDGDNVVIDFDTKKRMKYTIVEFDEGSQANTPASVFEAFQKETEERYQAQFSTYETELAELREFKATSETNAAIAARNEVIAQFEDIAENEEFIALCENMLDFDLDAFTEKCYAIRGRNLSNPTSATFSASNKLPKFPVESNGVQEVEYADAPYGGVVEKYKARV